MHFENFKMRYLVPIEKCILLMMGSTLESKMRKELQISHNFSNSEMTTSLKSLKKMIEMALEAKLETRLS